MSSQLPLILVSGLAADARLFAAQREAIPELITPAWIRPKDRESLGEYARRLAAACDPGGPCLVGGCSLGGMLAQEMARYLQARACLLISSIRSPGQLPWRYRMFRPAAGLATQVLRGLPWASRQLQRRLGKRLTPQQLALLEQGAEADGQFVRWAAWAILRWQPGPKLAIPVVHIHGTRDHVLPHRLTQPDLLIPGAGHVLPVTHPAEVNAFLLAQRERFG